MEYGGKPMLSSEGRMVKLSKKLAGDIACPLAHPTSHVF